MTEKLWAYYFMGSHLVQEIHIFHVVARTRQCAVQDFVKLCSAHRLRTTLRADSLSWPSWLPVVRAAGRRAGGRARRATDTLLNADQEGGKT